MLIGIQGLGFLVFSMDSCQRMAGAHWNPGRVSWNSSPGACNPFLELEELELFGMSPTNPDVGLPAVLGNVKTWSVIGQTTRWFRIFIENSQSIRSWH